MDRLPGPPPPGGYPPPPPQDPTTYRHYGPSVSGAMAGQPQQDVPSTQASDPGAPVPRVPPPQSNNTTCSSIPYHYVMPPPPPHHQPSLMPLPPPPHSHSHPHPHAHPQQGNPPSLSHQPQPVVVGAVAAVGSAPGQQVATVTPSPSIPLALPGDEEHLAKPLCLLRKQLEVFAATPQDISERKTGPKPPEGAVGLRCVHCAHLSVKTRGAVVYPRSISLIHQAVRNFQRHHFWRCPLMPHESKEMMNSLKPSKEQQSKRNSNEYWLNSARAIGLVDVNPVDAPPPPPPTEEDSTVPGGKKRKRVSINKMKKERGDAAPHMRFGAGYPGAVSVPQTVSNPSNIPPPPVADPAPDPVTGTGTNADAAAAEAAAYAAADAAAAAAAATADAINATTAADATPPLPGTPAPARPEKKPGHDIDAAEVLYGLAKKGDSNGNTPTPNSSKVAV